MVFETESDSQSVWKLRFRIVWEFRFAMVSDYWWLSVTVSDSMWMTDSGWESGWEFGFDWM